MQYINRVFRRSEEKLPRSSERGKKCMKKNNDFLLTLREGLARWNCFTVANMKDLSFT